MNTFRLTVKKVNYIVNENKVICNVEFTFRSMPFVLAAIGNHMATTTLKSNSLPNGTMVNKKGQTLSIKAKGIATCSPNDKFDETLGKRIAYSKAIIEGYRKYLQIIDTAHEALWVKKIDMLDNSCRIARIIEGEKVHLEELKNTTNVQSQRKSYCWSRREKGKSD